jgi:hypothetical protein
MAAKVIRSSHRYFPSRRPRSERTFRFSRFIGAPTITALHIIGTTAHRSELLRHKLEEPSMDGIIYLVGLIVIIMFVLSLFGLR